MTQIKSFLLLDQALVWGSPVLNRYCGPEDQVHVILKSTVQLDIGH